MSCVLPPPPRKKERKTERKKGRKKKVTWENNQGLCIHVNHVVMENESVRI